MQRADITLIVPNPLRADISRNLPGRILHQACISRDEWEAL